MHEAVEAYVALARRRGLTPVATGAGLRQEPVVLGAMIVGATSMAQLAEDVAAAQVELDAETLAEIAAVQVRFPNPAG